ncbi:unnamed protein product [Owenia fusiformis]|uniref:Uncharacterized protein n=1 Tax=Owenia fusiformis TaxID=6347 RepID=A0A8J1XGD9_OWEFU|nr:unnamed protein product [Owenia fusiformis]
MNLTATKYKMIRIPLKKRTILILVGLLGCVLVLKNVMLSTHTKEHADLKIRLKAVDTMAIHSRELLNRAIQKPPSEKSVDRLLKDEDAVQKQKSNLSDVLSANSVMTKDDTIEKHHRSSKQWTAVNDSSSGKRTDLNVSRRSKLKHKNEYDSNVIRYKDNPFNGVQPTGQLRVPDGSLTPSLVYFIWCGKKWFEFQHYLSVRSAIRFLNADRVILYYSNIPKVDGHRYNRWYEELMEDYPWFTRTRLKDNELGICKDDTSKRAFAMQKLSKTGGIYMTETTILTTPVNTLRKYPLVEAIQDGKGFMMVNKNAKINGTKKVRCSDLIVKRRKEAFVKLEDGHTVEGYRLIIDNAANDNVCITMPRTPTFVYPKDIWALDNAFGRAARDIFYGSPEVPKVRHSTKELAPNIAHMVLLGGRKMEYICYIGMLSILHIVKVEKLYIHGDKVPIGDLWEKISKDKRVEYVFHDLPKSVYSTEDNFLPQHVSDMMRVDIMIKYGGLYVDTDAIFVKPLDDYIRGYDVVATYDWATGWVPPWPDIINFGVTLGKRGAPFWHLFQHSMKDWWEKNWSYNGLQKPYKVYERHPHLVKINPHWQVICFGYEHGCHPTWTDWPTYFNRNTTHRDTGIDWRKDAYAFHWTDPTPPPFWGENHLINHKMDDFYKDFSAEVGRFVLEKAGLLDEIVKRVGDKVP